VEVKVTEPVVETIEVALTAIQGISNIDLAEGENNTITVWAENTGNVDAEATIGVTLNDNALESQTITLKAGKNGGASFTLPTEGLVAGTTANVVATLTVEGNTSEATTLAKDYNVVNSSVATEPVFEITAAPVEVEFGVEKFNVAATVKNTSTVGATNVEVKLYYNGDIATQTIAALAANAESEVTFADVTNPFTKAGTYTMYVMAPKAQAEVTVTVKPEPVVEKVDVAVFDLRGLNNIDLAAESNTVSVWVANNGNVDAEATISVTLNSTTLEAQTVNVKAAKDADSPTYADASFILPTEGLVAGEKATVVATVTVADNTSENTTITREYDIVNSSVATEPVFEITAAPVEVEFGAEKFNVVATVKNASTVNATDVEVKLYYNGEIATQTIATLTANAEAEVTFADVENPFTKAGTYTMYVRAPKAQAEVTVTVKPEPVVETIDLAVTSINGTLSLDIESNYLTVWVENKGNVDVNGAAVSLMAGETTLGTGTVNVKAGNNAFCSIAVAADMLQEGEFTVTAKVTAEGDVDETNNELSRTYTIEAPKAALSFTAEAQVLKDMLSYTVLVNVTNESTKADAENIEVKLYTENSKELTSAIIKKIAAGTTSSVVLSGVAEEALSGSILVMVNGSTSYVSLEVVDVITSINTVKAQMANGTLRVYTLNGKKAETVKSGSVYIINGKKVMVK
jgi:5-hydroxyisourate hydrolase-like protein (transthyretin family)